MHARRAILPMVLLVAYLLLHCGSRTQPALPSADIDMPRAAFETTAPPRTIEELKRRIGAIIEREHIAGVAIGLVGRDGPIWVGGIGLRDREANAPMDGDTAFRVGSLSKTMVSLGVMRLVEQGKLDLDRPLREILPDVAIDNPWEAVAPVTLAQCLEHTAGLDDVRFNEVFTDDEQLSVRDTLRLNPRSRRIRWRPGTRHSYSNVGYTVAARAIEVASGEPFDVYLRREVMAPMGIVDADFQRTDLIRSRLATGYLDDDTPAAFHRFAHRPSGSLLISASDLAKLVHFFIRRDGRVVSPSGLDRIEHSGTLPYGHLDGEYGFAIYGDVQHPMFARGHDGGMPGFHSSIRYFPEAGVGYVMLLNSNYAFRGYFEIRSLLFGYLTQGRTFTEPPTARGERPGAEFFAYGSPRSELFSFVDRVRDGWHVADVGDALRVTHLAGWSYDLVPAADGAYRRRRESGTSFRFSTNAEGVPVIVTGFEYGEAGTWWMAWWRYAALALTMVLLHIAPLWAVGTLGLAAIQRRRVIPPSLVVWPAIAGLACRAIPQAIEASFLRGVCGVVHPLTIAICALTIVLAFASTASLVVVVAWSRRPDRPSLALRVFPTLCAVAFFSFSLWLAANGWIGLRTWAW